MAIEILKTGINAMLREKAIEATTEGQQLLRDGNHQEGEERLKKALDYLQAGHEISEMLDGVDRTIERTGAPKLQPEFIAGLVAEFVTTSPSQHAAPGETTVEPESVSNPAENKQVVEKKGRKLRVYEAIFRVSEDGTGYQNPTIEDIAKDAYSDKDGWEAKKSINALRYFTNEINWMVGNPRFRLHHTVISRYNQLKNFIIGMGYPRDISDEDIVAVSKRKITIEELRRKYGLEPQVSHDQDPTDGAIEIVPHEETDSIATDETTESSIETHLSGEEKEANEIGTTPSSVDETDNKPAAENQEIGRLKLRKFVLPDGAILMLTEQQANLAQFLLSKRTSEEIHTHLVPGSKYDKDAQGLNNQRIRRLAKVLMDTKRGWILRSENTEHIKRARGIRATYWIDKEVPSEPEAEARTQESTSVAEGAINDPIQPELREAAKLLDRVIFPETSEDQDPLATSKEEDSVDSPTASVSSIEDAPKMEKLEDFGPNQLLILNELFRLNEAGTDFAYPDPEEILHASFSEKIAQIPPDRLGRKLKDLRKDYDRAIEGIIARLKLVQHTEDVPKTISDFLSEMDEHPIFGNLSITDLMTVIARDPSYPEILSFPAHEKPVFDSQTFKLDPIEEVANLETRDTRPYSEPFFENGQLAVVANTILSLSRTEAHKLGIDLPQEKRDFMVSAHRAFLKQLGKQADKVRTSVGPAYHRLSELNEARASITYARFARPLEQMVVDILSRMSEIRLAEFRQAIIRLN
jgi:hypothetical protein